MIGEAALVMLTSIPSCNRVHGVCLAISVCVRVGHISDKIHAIYGFPANKNMGMGSVDNFIKA